VAQVVPAGVELPDTGAVERATGELAAALTRAPDGDGVEPEEAQAVVSAFTEADLVEFSSSDETLQPATLAVVLTGSAPERLSRPSRCSSSPSSRWPARSTSGRRARSSPAGRFRGRPGHRARPALGADAGAGGVDRRQRRPRHRLVTLVLALAEQRRGGAGQYGTGEGASTALPCPPAQ
jgi:hypothetical protein